MFPRRRRYGGWNLSLIHIFVYMIKPIRFVKEKQAEIGSALLTLSVAFLMAKLGITSGASIKDVISAGPVLILQNLGNVGTPVSYTHLERWPTPELFLTVYSMPLADILWMGTVMWT